MQKGHGEILIITTIDQLDKAEALARGLIEKKLAACVTRLPGARSSYRWESDEIKDETEVLLFIKSHHMRLGEIEQYFKENHPYSVPEILVFSVDEIAPEYSRWLLEQVGV
ncbi:divalent-cation tolerance protein CutA [bacterium]|nr:divalent-cation tolerance protein CutA [bacterium]